MWDKDLLEDPDVPIKGMVKMLTTQHQDHPIPGDYIGCIQKGFPPEPEQYVRQVVDGCLG